MSFAKDLALISYYYDFHSLGKYEYDDKDIGLQPASGLKSPSLSESELEENLSSAECKVNPYQLLSTRNMESKETRALGRKACIVFYI